MRQCGRVNDKIFARSISGNKTTFFWPGGKRLIVFGPNRCNDILPHLKLTEIL